jgi:hypothetical protein
MTSFSLIDALLFSAAVMRRAVNTIGAAIRTIQIVMMLEATKKSTMDFPSHQSVDKTKCRQGKHKQDVCQPE